MSPSNLLGMDMKISKPFLVPTENVVCLDSSPEYFPNSSSQIRLSGTATRQFQYELQREETSADVKNKNIENKINDKPVEFSLEAVTDESSHAVLKDRENFLKKSCCTILNQR